MKLVLDLAPLAKGEALVTEYNLDAFKLYEIY